MSDAFLQYQILCFGQVRTPTLLKELFSDGPLEQQALVPLDALLFCFFQNGTSSSGPGGPWGSLARFPFAFLSISFHASSPASILN